MGCNMLVSCPGPATHMPCPGTSHLQFSHQSRRYMLHGFWNRLPFICMRKWITFHADFLHCTPIYVNLKKFEKISFTTYFVQKRIFMCQIVSVHLSWKIIRKTWNKCVAGSIRNRPVWVEHWDQSWDSIRKVSRSFPRSLLSIVYYPYLSLPLSSVDYYFICIFDPYLVHVPDFLKLLEFTVFHRCGDKPWKGTWEAFSHRCGYKHHWWCGYRCELFATLGRGEGTEIENRHQWPMIRSKCLFGETSIRIDKYAFQGAFGVVTHDVMWGSYAF